VSALAGGETAVKPRMPAQIPADGVPAGLADAGAGLIRVRQAVPGDREALARMFERCTASTRYRRFHGPVKAIPERYLAEALSGRPLHYALVAFLEPAAAVQAAEALSDGIVALASCRLVDEGAAELGILVEDAWQRQGLGTRLVNELVAHANAVGLRVLEAQLLAEHAWITRLLRPHGTCRLRSTWNGVLNVTVRLASTRPLVLGPLRAPQMPQRGSATRQYWP
jgi:GNAT superfamily N-acetyltransferase